MGLGVVRESAEDQVIPGVGTVAGAPVVAGISLESADCTTAERGVAGAAIDRNERTTNPRIRSGADIHRAPGGPDGSDINGRDLIGCYIRREGWLCGRVHPNGHAPRVALFDVRQKVKEEWPVVGTREGSGHGRQAPLRILDVVQRQPKLLQIVRALGSVSG